MRIKRILIKNFRSIKTLEFFPNDICALVGENNAGKSNILAAINFLLGESWPTKQRLEPRDYYEEDTTQPIHVEVEFHDNPCDYKRIWFTAPWEDKAETRMQYTTSDEPYYLSSEVRDRCALVYLDANRDLDYHLRHSSWALFGRIIRRLDEDFREWATGNQQAQLRRRFEQARDLLRTPLFQEFESGVKSAFSEQIRRTTHRIELEFQTFDPLNYYRAIQLHLWENERQRSPSESGQGMRNLILLALFRAYAKVFKDDAIIAIEEPEIFLHPHTQRSLHTLFDELAEEGAQIFYSTHSGTFVDIEHFDRICLVKKQSETDGDLTRHFTSVTQVSPDGLLEARQSLHPQVPMSTKSLRERYRNICTLAQNEAFFAKKVVLVEGETEENTLPFFARALDYDFDAHGVSVVNAHGKTNLDQLYQLYTLFEIPVYLIFDGDRDTADDDSRRWNCILLRMLGEPGEEKPDQRIATCYAVFEQDFENSLESALEAHQTGSYANLRREGKGELGSSAGKGLVGRYIAKRLVETSKNKPQMIPDFIRQVIERVRRLGEVEVQDIETGVSVSFDNIPF
jgi:putative ATP-dependent endonuclease of OLD family